MGQQPNKMYTAPDGTIYRVEADGTITKIKDGSVLSNETPSKYNITPDGRIYRIEVDGSVTYLGNAEEKSSPLTNYKAHSIKTHKGNWIWIILSLLVIISVCCGILIYNKMNTTDNYYPIFKNETEAINYIVSYYNSFLQGNVLDYFEEDNITFFDIVNGHKSDIQKRLKNIDRSVKWDYDWSTLKIIQLPSDETMLVFSFDYSIYKPTYTDRYRITTEMIVNSNKKIVSIRDLQTEKLSRYPN